MTRMSEVERVALDELFLGLPSDGLLSRIILNIKRLFKID